MLATGRTPNTKNMGLEEVGIKLAKNGKIIVNAFEQTTVENIYAFGDVAIDRPELTPPAIMAGKLLARRLFNNEKTLMDYDNIATTVYTNIEYGSCGMSEEKAIEKFGKQNIKAYHCEFTPVEWTIDGDNEETCYMKVIVNTADKNRVVGFHIFAPNAGEITQGVSVAMKCKVTKDKLDATVGIHPTIAEEMTTLDTTKDQGDGKKSGC
jgi:thioredoxin reductase (NADPH)